MEIFAHDEHGYREWVETHGTGFVLVSWNPPRSEYISVHCADCHTINPAKAPHKENWTKSYIKVCADTLAELTTWAISRWGRSVVPLRPCDHCKRAGRLSIVQPPALDAEDHRILTQLWEELGEEAALSPDLEHNMDAKEAFLIKTQVKNEDDALRNCISATFKRNKLYRYGWGNTSQSQKHELHLRLKAELQRLALLYKGGIVSEADHEMNIQGLADDMSKRHGAILLNGRFNIGTSQKALNLYLKFLWCLGQLAAEPIHCPVDNIILGRASIYAAWTQLDDVQTYRIWISKIRNTAKLQSLAAWELEAWNMLR